MSSCSLTSALRLARSADLEIFDFAASFYGSDQPARLLPPTGPGRRRLWVAIFRNGPRVLTPCLAIRVVGLRSIFIFPLNDVPAPIENRQTPFELTLFGRDPRRQYLTDLFMERPEVIERHRLEIDLL